MAEQLGQAVLEITVDDKKLRDGLNRARNTIERAGGEFKLNLGGSDQQLQRLAATAKTLETQLKKLQSTPLNLGTRDLAKLGGDFSKAGTELSAFTRSVINGDSALANSTAGLRQQALAFRTLAANVKFTSTEFKNFTQAAAKAGQKELFAGFQQINAQESLFKLGGFGGNDTFKGTEQLLEFSKKVGTTPAAINLYITALEQALSVTSTTDANFAKLTAEIQKQANALTTAAAAADRYISSLSKQAPALPPAKGPAPFTLDAPTPEEAAAEERRKRREQKIADRIDYISTGGRDLSEAPNGFVPRPDPKAIAAEERLQAARNKARQATLKAAEADERAAKSRAKRRNEIVGNALIGGAFPALFGQGLGASAGGALGGGLGGAIGGNFGFGLSLVGTALGQAVDTALQQFADLGAAIDAPAKNFSALQQAAVLSSRGLERTVEGLIAAGRYGEANAVIQADLIATFGDLSAAQSYRDQVDQLNRAWAQASVSTASFIAGPLAELIKRLRLSIGGKPQNNEERQFQEQSRRNIADTFSKAGLFVGSIGGAAALTPGAQLPGLATLGIGALLTGIGRLAGQGGGNPADEDLKPLVEATNRIVAARARSLDLAKAERQQIVAQAQGNQTAADAAERLAAASRRDEAIAADPSQAQAAWLEYEKTIIGVNERQKQREKELTGTITQEVIKRQQIAQSIEVARAQRDAALAAADSAANPGNSTLAARAGQLDSVSFLAQNRLRIEEAVTRERQLQAQLAQESDPTKRSQLAEQLKSAAFDIQLAGEQAGTALAQKAADAAKSLRSAQDALRGTLESNFKYLPRDQRKSLLDSAREDIARGKATGILRPDFGTAGRRRTLDAARAVRDIENQRAQVAQLQAAQQPLVEALNANTNAERNIRINITMNADGTATANQTDAQAALL